MPCRHETNSVRIGVYICHCGLNIASKVDVRALTHYASGLPHVAVAREYKFMCSDPGQELIQQDLKDGLVNRVVVASCSPLMHEPTFRTACERAGMNRYLFQMANIREQCSWVHTDADSATSKAKALPLSAFFSASVPSSLYKLACRLGLAGINQAYALRIRAFTLSFFSFDYGFFRPQC